MSSPASDYGPIYQAAGKQYNVDPRLLQAVIATESNGDPNAVSSAGAVGPAQLMPQTAQSLGVTNPRDPTQAIYGAAELLDQNLKRYGSPDKAILAYHGGTDEANWGPKTQAYLQKVTAAYQGQGMTQAQPANDAFSAAFAPSSAGSSANDNDAFSAAFSSQPAAPKGVGGIRLATPQEVEEFSQSSPDAALAAKNQPANNGLPASPDNTGLINGARNFAISALPGVGIPLMAGAQAVKNTVGDVFNGMPVTNIGNDLSGTYQQARDIYQANRLQYQQAHPVESAVTSLAGNALATIPAMALGGEVLAPVIGAVKSAVPAAVQANKLVQLGTLVAKGATQGATANALVAPDTGQSLSDAVKSGAEFGGALGVAAPAVGKVAGAGWNALTGGGVSPAVANLAGKAADLGIPLRAGQISSSPFIRYADSFFSKMPFTGYAAKDEAAKEAFTRAVSNTFGEDSPSLTQDVMANARSRIGSVFDRVASNTAVKADDQFVNDLATVESEASQALPGSEFSPIKNQINNLFSKVSPAGEIDGSTYQALTRKGAPLDRAMSSPDSNVRFYAGKVRDALDDALERSANPEDLNALSEARLQWKNMRTVQDLAAKAGIEGEISPSGLLGAVKKSYKDLPYSGAGEIGDLANIGQRFLKEQPSSGTGERISILELMRHNPLASLMLAGAEGAGAATHPAETALGTVGFLGGNAIAARLLDNPLYRAMLLRSGRGPGIVGRALSSAGDAVSPYAVPLGAIAGNRLFAPQPAPAQ